MRLRLRLRLHERLCPRRTRTRPVCGHPLDAPFPSRSLSTATPLRRPVPPLSVSAACDLGRMTDLVRAKRGSRPLHGFAAARTHQTRALPFSRL
jgi:hypothetical protein